MQMPRRIKLQALFSCFRGSSPKKTVQPAVADPEAMGYAGFYIAVLSNVSMHDLTASLGACCDVVVMLKQFC